jgi:hypothetical protein
LLTARDIPERIRKEYRRIGAVPDGEKRLYVEMTARAVMDAYGHTGMSDPVKHNVEVSDARHWFQSGETLEFFFAMADVSLTIVRAEVLKASVDCYMEIPDDKKYGANGPRKRDRP